MQGLTLRVLPYALLLAGFALRLNGLTFQSLWRDEIDALRFAAGGAVTSLRQAGWNGPLYTFALKPWIDATGTSEFTLRFSSVLAAVVLLALLYRVGRRLLGEQGARVTALLAIASPYLIWYAQELKMYSLLAMLGVASYASLLSALDRGRWPRWALYAVVTSILPYVHILGVLLLPAQGLALLLSWRTYARRRAWLTTMALMSLPYLPLAIWQAPYLAGGVQTGHLYYPLPAMLSILAHAWPLGIVGVPGLLPLLPFAAALLAAVVVPLTPALSAPERKAATAGGTGANLAAAGAGRLLWAWLLVPVALVWLISLRSPVFTDRYLIASLPALLLLLALGVTALARLWRPAALLLLALLLAVSLYALLQQWRYQVKTDARGAAAVVREQWQDGDVLLLQIPYMRFSMDYYLGSDHPMVDGPFTNYGMTEAEFEGQVRPQLAGHRRLWLVLSEAEMWDARGLTLQWCRARLGQAGEWHFARMDLYLFVMSKE
ncbi:MAG: glycosyltransferase family 39 protein [Anaerolineae bacterium]